MKPVIRVLIADDNIVDRKLLVRIVGQQGHQVIEAENGREALEAFREQQPDIVLLDVMMPEMDGKEAAMAIKEEAGEAMVPIIFLTSLNDANSLAACLESGGDDFLTKPYNPVILQAKIRSFWRMRDMHSTLQNQMDTIASHNEHLMHEQRAAKAVFDNVAHRGCLSAANIQYVLSPMSVFNGDVLLAARAPTGNLILFIGDFTGHGLPAAIGAMPLAEIFYGMTAKGFGVSDIIREINSKMGSILPVGFFCCGVMAQLDYSERSLQYWSGGLPEGYLLRAHDQSLMPIVSTHLPLGVLSNERFDNSLTETSMEEGDRLLLLSDGILEARNRNGDMFGEQRLRAAIQAAPTVDQAFGYVEAALSDFQQGGERDDDITLLEAEMVNTEESNALYAGGRSGGGGGPMDWKFSYELGTNSLQETSTLPTLMHILMEVPGLKAMSGRLYTVLSELYSNALEHGVLGLDSGLKATPEGFARYYQQREQRLEDLIGGFVRIQFQHEGNGESGELRIRVEDSGRGFDYRNTQPLPEPSETLEEQSHKYSGRGIVLISEICESLQYYGDGNQVEAIVKWPQALQN